MVGMVERAHPELPLIASWQSNSPHLAQSTLVQPEFQQMVQTALEHSMLYPRGC